LSNEWYIDARLGEKHVSRSTSITALFRKGIPLVTTMSITGHKSESSYRIYARPSNKQKKETLSQLINSVGTLPSSNDQFLQATPPIKDKSSLTKPFRQPLSTKNLPLYINTSKPVLTLG
ncbi:13936_t:CDS:2, partial [Racocetra persica]